MNNAYLPTTKDAARVGFTMPHNMGEPSFRVYAKHAASREVEALQHKHKNRLRMAKLGEPLIEQLQRSK